MVRIMNPTRMVKMRKRSAMPAAGALVGLFGKGG